MYLSLFKCDLDEVSLLDESYNRVASILSTQCNIACSSICCEVNVLMELSKGLISNHFDDQLVTKVLNYIIRTCLAILLPISFDQVIQHISYHCGYQSMTTYLEHHMIHLLYHWLNNGFELDSFPYQLFDKTSGQFYR